MDLNRGEERGDDHRSYSSWSALASPFNRRRSNSGSADAWRCRCRGTEDAIALCKSSAEDDLYRHTQHASVSVRGGECRA